VATTQASKKKGAQKKREKYRQFGAFLVYNKEGFRAVLKFLKRCDFVRVGHYELHCATVKTKCKKNLVTRTAWRSSHEKKNMLW